jgi:hypothetical protein
VPHRCSNKLQPKRAVQQSSSCPLFLCTRHIWYLPAMPSQLLTLADIGGQGGSAFHHRPQLLQHRLVMGWGTSSGVRISSIHLHQHSGLLCLVWASYSSCADPSISVPFAGTSNTTSPSGGELPWYLVCVLGQCATAEFGTPGGRKHCTVCIALPAVSAIVHDVCITSTSQLPIFHTRFSWCKSVVLAATSA